MESVREKIGSIFISVPHLLSQPLSSDSKNKTTDEIKENDSLSRKVDLILSAA